MRNSKPKSQYEYEVWFEKTCSRAEFWFELSKNKNQTTATERKFAFRIGKLRKNDRFPSFKQLKWAYEIVDRIIPQTNKKTIIKRKKGSKETKIIMPSTQRKHITSRMAWHDNKWNGKICISPEKNEYCVGDYSLLSARLQRRRNLDIECKNNGEIPNYENMGNYVPPCFWSLNTFGEESFDVIHEHPMKETHKNIKSTPDVKEHLPPYSFFTWNFKISFLRDNNPLSRIDGKYPKNLPNRANKFFSQIKENESVVFLYCNYDNPVTADEYKYLLIGCGLVKNKGDFFDYQIPKNDLDEIRSDKDFKNFPTLGWELRVSLDPENTVRLPYHEYLSDLDEDIDWDLLDDIKITIDDEKLAQDFKYVAMDIDDDTCIFLLTKIKQKLDLVGEHNRYNDIYDVDHNLKIIEKLLQKTWTNRGCFPTLDRVLKIIVEKTDEPLPLPLTTMIKNKISKGTDWDKFIIQLFKYPEKITDNDSILDTLDEVNDWLNVKCISAIELLQICMLDLTDFQLERILNGNLNKDKKNVAIAEVSKNLYLLCEEYEPDDKSDDQHTGLRRDNYIPLYKVDIALFPDTKYSRKLRAIQTLSPGDPRRLRALVLSYLSSLENSTGDCFDFPQNIQKFIYNYPLFYKSKYIVSDTVLKNPTDELLAHFSGKLACEKDSDGNFRYYLKEIYDYEQTLQKQFIDLLSRPDFEGYSPYDYVAGCKRLKEKNGDIFNEEEYLNERNKLYKHVFKKRLFILSGSPGTGKSYELLKIIETLRDNSETYIVLTPTGKASLRLTVNEEGINDIRCMTIDKLLYSIKQSNFDVSDIQNLIIDEMSMVDLVKIAKLIESFNIKRNSFKRLILVGDQYQLPPIGYGKVFVDIIRFISSGKKYKNNFIQLDVNLRQKADKDIITFSKIYAGQIKNYEEILTKAVSGLEFSDFFKIHYWKTREELQVLLFESFNKRYNSNNTYDDFGIILNRVLNLEDDGTIKKDSDNSAVLGIDNFQVLTPYRASHFGTIGLNKLIQDKSKKDSDTIGNTSFSFRHGDKVIQTKNLYRNGKLLLSNGSTGVADANTGRGQFYFAEFSKPLGSNILNQEEMELAYAITVHKSQGSGFKDVFFVLPPKKSLLHRELIYTGLTRSREALELFIYGEPDQDYDKSILEQGRRVSNIELRKTTLFDNSIWDYSLSPEEGTIVKSRIEYIIYKKLLVAQKEWLNTDFAFEFTYEKPYSPSKRNFTIKPDFTIKFKDGRIIYWEHLGMLTSKFYVDSWNSRLEIYKEDGLLDVLVTTDDMYGIDDKAINIVIDDIICDELKVGSVNHSKHHYSLRL